MPPWRTMQSISVKSGHQECIKRLEQMQDYPLSVSILFVLLLLNLIKKCPRNKPAAVAAERIRILTDVYLTRYSLSQFFYNSFPVRPVSRVSNSVLKTKDMLGNKLQHASTSSYLFFFFFFFFFLSYFVVVYLQLAKSGSSFICQ